MRHVTLARLLRPNNPSFFVFLRLDVRLRAPVSRRMPLCDVARFWVAELEQTGALKMNVSERRETENINAYSVL